MDLAVFNDYWAAVSVLEAQEGLVQMSMMDWPNLKRPDRSKRHRELHRIAFPKSWQESKPVSGEDMARIIKGLIGG